MKKSIALLAVFAASLLTAQAEDLTYKLRKERLFSKNGKAPVKERRIPAQVRVRRGFTPYQYESRNASMFRHDELTSHVMVIHTYGRGTGWRAGHSLAPRVDRIAKP